MFVILMNLFKIGKEPEKTRAMFDSSMCLAETNRCHYFPKAISIRDAEYI